MQITVFGASGGVGREVVSQAARLGHRVTAVVRDPASFGPVPDGVRVAVADVMDPAAIAPLIEGSDAVVSALGNRLHPRRPNSVCSDAVASIVSAMDTTGARRLVVVSASGLVTDSADGPLLRYVAKPLLWAFLAGNYADLERMEAMVRASGLDWTIVRPSRLVDRPQGAYRVEVGRNLRGGRTSRRADVADYILKGIRDSAAVRQAVSVAL